MYSPLSRQKTSSFLSADTPEFAVEAIESWWLTKGIKRYSKNKLLILVDGGGSNGHRCHMWKIASVSPALRLIDTVWTIKCLALLLRLVFREVYMRQSQCNTTGLH